MGQSVRFYFVVALSLLFDDIGSVHAVDTETIVSCDDIPEAINYLHQHLPPQMTLEDKCIRYAVITSMIRPKGRLHNQAVIKVMNMSEEQLIKIYEDLRADNELGAQYMTAVDGYRAASMLGPALLELIECLKKVDDITVRMYLDGEELQLILALYQQIIQSPGEKINMANHFSLNTFSRAFLISLKHIFRDQIQFDTGIKRFIDKSGEMDERPYTSPPSQHLLPDHPSSETGRLYLRRQERKRLAAHRHREQERLRRQRQKILDPVSEREKARFWQKQRRLLLRLENEEKAKLKLGAFARRPVPIAPKPTFITSVPASLQYVQQQLQQNLHQQQEPPSHPEVPAQEPSSPELAQLWSEVASLYESIPTPAINSPEIEQPMPTPDDAAETPKAPEPSSSDKPILDLLRQLEQSGRGQDRRRRRHQHNERRLRRLNRTPPDPSATQPAIPQPSIGPPLTGHFDRLPPAETINLQQIETPMAPYQRYPHNGPSQVDPFSTSFTFSQNSDNRLSHAEHYFNPAASAMSTLDSVHGFDDTDEVMQSFRDPSDVDIDLDEFVGRHIGPDHDFDSSKRGDR